MKNDKRTSRRQWLRGSLRWGLLSAMTGLSAHLLLRKPGIEESSCRDPQGHSGCRGCLSLGGCKLPRALSVKQFLNRGNEERKS